jgi:hypothetical protein
MQVTIEGILNFVNREHEPNIPLRSDVRPGAFIPARLEHSTKARSPRSVTVGGREMRDKELQQLKAELPMVVTRDGIPISTNE